MRTLSTHNWGAAMAREARTCPPKEVAPFVDGKGDLAFTPAPPKLHGTLSHTAPSGLQPVRLT